MIRQINCLQISGKVCKKVYQVSKYFVTKTPIEVDANEADLLIEPLTPDNKLSNQNSIHTINHKPSHKPNYTLPHDQKTSHEPKSNREGVNREGVNREKVKRNVTHLMKMKVVARQRMFCNNCNDDLDETLEIDHVIPLFLGGTNDLDNLAALCPKCHRKKSNQERENARLNREAQKWKIQKGLISPYFSN